MCQLFLERTIGSTSNIIGPIPILFTSTKWSYLLIIPMTRSLVVWYSNTWHNVFYYAESADQDDWDLYIWASTPKKNSLWDWIPKKKAIFYPWWFSSFNFQKKNLRKISQSANNSCNFNRYTTDIQSLFFDIL